MCDRPPAGERPAASRIPGSLPMGRLPEESAPDGTPTAGGSTAECHVVRGYRFHRPSASGSGCPATCVGACPGGDKPDGSCRAAEGYVDAQTTLRTRTCDRRWSRRPTALPDTTRNETGDGRQRPQEGR